MENELELTFKWENRVGVKVEANNNGDSLTILKMDENGDIAALWPHAQELLMKYCLAQLQRIGAEMAAK